MHVPALDHIMHACMLMWHACREHWRRLRRGGGAGKEGQRRPRGPRALSGAGKPRHSVVTHYNAITQARACKSLRCP